MIDQVERGVEPPKDYAHKIKAQTLESLQEIPSIRAGGFRPVLMRTIADDERTKKVWNTATKIAWGLRIGDASSDQEFISTVKEELERFPDVQYYVTYQLLTDSVEEEKSLPYALKKVSASLKNYTLDVLKERLRTTKDQSDLVIFNDVASRVFEWHSLAAKSDSTFVGTSDVTDIYQIIEAREKAKDKLFSQPDAKITMDTLRKTIGKSPEALLQ